MEHYKNEQHSYQELVHIRTLFLYTKIHIGNSI